MPMVKIKERYQMTIPAAVCRKAGLDVGDLLEARLGKTGERSCPWTRRRLRRKG